jgi:hypothetical protein
LVNLPPSPLRQGQGYGGTSCVTLQIVILEIIKCIPVFTTFAFLDLGQNSSFLDEHYIRKVGIVSLSIRPVFDPALGRELEPKEAHGRGLDIFMA